MTHRLTDQEFMDQFGDDMEGMYVERWMEYRPDHVQDHPTFRVWKTIKDMYNLGIITMYPPWAEDCVEFLEYCDTVLGEKPPYYGIGTRVTEKGYVPGNIFFKHHRSRS